MFSIFRQLKYHWCLCWNGYYVFHEPVCSAVHPCEIISIANRSAATKPYTAAVSLSNVYIDPD